MKNLVAFWGWTRSDQSYQKLIDSAPEGWKIYPVAYEHLMPHGNVSAFKANLFNFLNQNNLTQFHLMGHSLGGALAIEVAYQYPEKVQNLFLLDSEGIYEPQPILEVVHGVFRQHPKYKSQHHHRWESFRRIVRHPVLHARLGHYAYKADLQKEAGQIKAPTTILWGEDDKVTPLRQGQKLHQLIPDSKLIVLKDEGHDWILYNPELFWQNID